MYVGDAAIYATSPVNVTANVGSSAIFRCKTDSGMPIRWNRIIPNQRLPIVIYNGYFVGRQLSFKYSVRVNLSIGLGELEVRDIGLLDSGTFACHQLNSSVNKAMFYLSVTGKFHLVLLCLPQKMHVRSAIGKLHQPRDRQNIF